TNSIIIKYTTECVRIQTTNDAVIVIAILRDINFLFLKMFCINILAWPAGFITDLQNNYKDIATASVHLIKRMYRKCVRNSKDLSLPTGCRPYNPRVQSQYQAFTTACSVSNNMTDIFHHQRFMGISLL
ncbi:hypothetical protein L9F63_025030, partial [Diploptera punctata]